MTTPVPGTHIICTSCGGEGNIREPKRAMMTGRPEIHALNTFRRCEPCEGTGWLPPRYEEVAEEPGGDEVDN